MAINQWAYVFSYDMFGQPADSAFTLPGACPSDITHFSQGVAQTYWNYDTCYRGYGMIQLGWDLLDEPYAKAFRQAWRDSYTPLSYGAGVPNGRLWFMRYSPETATWEYTSGIVVDVNQADYSGVVAVGSTVTIARLNLHKNVHPTAGTVKDAMGYVDAGNTFEWGQGDFQANNWPGV